MNFHTVISIFICDALELHETDKAADFHQRPASFSDGDALRPGVRLLVRVSSPEDL